jgi:hypothetical protein
MAQVISLPNLPALDDGGQPDTGVTFGVLVGLVLWAIAALVFVSL